MSVLVAIGFGGMRANATPGPGGGDDDLADFSDSSGPPDDSGGSADFADSGSGGSEDSGSSGSDRDDNSGSDSSGFDSGSSGGSDDYGSGGPDSGSSDDGGSGGGDDHGSSGSDSGSLDGGGSGDDSSGGSDSGSSGDGGSGGGDDSGSGGSDSGSSDDGGSGGGDGSSGSDSGSSGDSGSGGGESGGSGSSDDGGSSGSNSGSSNNSGSSGDDGEDDNSGSNSSGSNSGSSNSGSSEFALNQDQSFRLIAVERDERGEERAAGEALLTGTQHDIDAAREAGFVPIAQTTLRSLDCAMARLSLPAGMSVEQAVATLRDLAPNALITANTVYHSSEATVAAARPRARAARARAFQGTIGIIDTGVSASALDRPEALLSQRAFASSNPAPNEHGAAVAALAIDEGMRVHVADVFGPATNGVEVASAESIAAALDWMLQSNVPVINISIEGPNNVILQALVRRASERGHVIVAAAGNGGPLARPAFPAAFEGSVAVTAIDERNRPYMRANRGDYIAFAAPGVNISVHAGNDDLVVSGTSFAAPLVAAEIARQLQTPSPDRARAVLHDLRQHAIDLGAPGRDPIFGWGAVRR